MTALNNHHCIHVVAGIIWNADKTQLLISKRPSHLHKGGLWEFPGGKVDSGESEQQALARELLEELNIEFSCAEKFKQLDFDYPDKRVSLVFFNVYGITGNVNGNEQQLWKWIPKAHITQYEFPEANQSIIDALVKII